MYQGDMQQLSN